MRTTLRTWWRENERWYLAVGLANLILGTSSVLIPLTVSALLGLSVGSLGLLSSLVSLIGVFGSLVWGRLSDAAHRRKPFVILSYVAVGACFAGMGFIYSFEQLALLNMALNFFWVANASVTVLIVIENQGEGNWEKKIGRLNQMGALGWVLGLIVGSGAMAIGARLVGEVTAVRASFMLLGFLGLAAAVLAARWIPRRKGHRVERSFRGIVAAAGNFLVERVRFGPSHLYYRLNLRRLWSHWRSSEVLRPGTRRFLMATLFAFLALGLFGIPLPLLLAQRFGISSSVVFLYFAVQNAAVVAAYPFATRLIRSSGNRRVQMGALSIRLALFVAAAVYLAFSRTTPPTPILVAFFAVYGFTWSYFQLTGIALTSRLAKPENRGLALGLYNGLAGVGWILAGVGSGYLAEWAGYQAAFAASAAFLVVSLVILRTVPEPTGDPDGGSPEGSDLETAGDVGKAEPNPPADSAASATA
jgi:MFS family permease